MLKFFPGIRWIWIVALGTLLDQLSKTYILSILSLGESKVLMPSLNFTLSYNLGVAFGWLNSGSTVMQWVLLGLTCSISLGMFVWMLRTPRRMPIQAVSLALIVGGAFGNLLDRIFRGNVVDFIDFYIGHWHFHTFNVADSLITIGALLLVLVSFKNEENSEL